MGTIDITNKVKYVIKFGLIGLIEFSALIGDMVFNYKHQGESIDINNARVAGTMVSTRVLTTGKVKELTKSDGDEVKVGDVIAKIEVSVTEDQIKQLENAVELAKANYAQLQMGQMVKVPVRKPKIKPAQAAPQQSSTSNKAPKSLAALEERKNRMELLYDMGAVSRKELEAAIKEYELAKTAGTAASEANTAPNQSDIAYEIEYIEQLQPTPPEILNGAQLAIKQAELSLNVARQEAQQTEVVAPVSGTIYYSVEAEEEVNAGDIVARIGDSSELWLEAEVTESQFDKISLGKLVSYVIDGNELTGTVMEKIAPSSEEEAAVETIESPTATNEPQSSPVPVEPVPNSTSEADTTAEQHTGVGGPESEVPPEQTVTAGEIAVQNETVPSSEQTATAPNSATTQEKAPTGSDDNPAHKDKYIVKVSLSTERNFECKPNMSVAITVKI